MRSLTLFTILLLLFSFALQAIPNKNKVEVRDLIQSKKFELAQSTIESLSMRYPGDITEIELLETELDIYKAEHLYQSGNHLSAFKKFTEAQKRWGTHPLVQLRISELKNKQLFDRTSFTGKNVPKNTSKKNPEVGYKPFYSERENQDVFLIQAHELRIMELEKKMNLLYIVIAILCCALIGIVFSGKR